jgi:hypothetical protein
VSFGETLVHEFQHAKLGALLDLVDLYDTTDERLFYSPWRDDPRPAGGLLQGAYAYLGVADFWRRRWRAIGTARPRFQYARAVAQVRHAVHALATSEVLTDIGTRFVSGMAAALDRWESTDPADDGVGQAAAATVADHRTRWLLVNGRYDTSRVDTLARAWLSADDPPAALPRRRASSPADQTLVDDSRLQLIRTRTCDPVAFDRLLRDRRALVEFVGPLTPADIALVVGDHHDALHGFAAQLAADADDQDAWSGLAVTGRRLGATWAEHPDLLRAVHRRLRELAGTVPDPLALANWVGSHRDSLTGPRGTPPP